MAPSSGPAAALLALCLIAALRLPSPAAASLHRLRAYQRECFAPAQPCFMFMDKDKAYGCRQCGDDVRQEVVREFLQRKDLNSFLESDNDPRIIMVPEYLFYFTPVLNALKTSKTVTAVVVYEPTPGATALPFPPLRDDEMSTELFEPNQKYNLYIPPISPSASPFPFSRNPTGKGLKYELYPFNIFRVNATTADLIRRRAERFPENSNPPNTDGRNKSSSTSPRYKLQSIGQMYACPSGTATPSASAGADNGDTGNNPITETVNSAKCLADRTCLPVGGQSLWSALEWINSTIPNNERRILAITAPMDSSAFFEDRALGASAEIVSLAVLMAVAQAVGDYRRNAGKDRAVLAQPVYFAWNAQSWGYAGSSRFLKDVNEFTCTTPHDGLKSGCKAPFMQSLKFLDFREANFTVLNIGQLAPSNQANPFHFFRHSAPLNRTYLTEIERILSRQFGSAGIPNSAFPQLELKEGPTDLIPIDSSQSFHRYLPGTDMVSLTSYETNFTNTLYHSIYDNVTLIPNLDPIVAAASAIAKTVIEFSFGDADPSIQVPEDVIAQVPSCLADDWNKCELAKTYMGGFFPVDADGNPSPVSPGNYAGAYYPPGHLNSRNPSAAAKLAFIRSFLAYHNRYEIGGKCEMFRDCEQWSAALKEVVQPETQSDLRATFCANRFCIASDAYTHNAYGTALTAVNDAQSLFKYTNTSEEEGNPALQAQLDAGWTESVWDRELGLCGFVEDTALFGGLVLGAGVGVLLISAALAFWFDRMMFKVVPEVEETQRLVLGEASV